MTAAAAIAEYHRLLQARPAAGREQAEWLREAFVRAGVVFDSRPMPSFVRPHLVGRAEWESLRSHGVRVLEIASRVARHVFDGDVSRLCAFLGTPAAEARWVALDPGEPDVVLSRLDAFLTPPGPRFIEINSDAPAGFGYGDRMAGLVRGLPVFREFARRVAVSYRPSSEALVRAVTARGRGAGGVVGDAYGHEQCPFVNSFRCRLSEDKACFAVLTDETFAHLVSEAERALIARTLPWTRRLAERRTMKDGAEIDLVPFTLANRAGLVLQPAHAYGRRAVLLGAEAPPGHWESAVRAGLEAPWIVQERVPIPEEPFPVFEQGDLRLQPLKVNANPFYVAGEEAGAVTRASRGAVINVSAGGGSVPTFVVE